MLRFKSLTLTAVLAALVVFGLAGLAAADEAKKPKYKPFHTIVGLEAAQAVSEGKVEGYLIDSRPAVKKFNKGHIPGAVNIPFSQFDKMTNLLPQDKSALIIFYCEGPACSLSHKSAYKAEAMGYTKVKVFPGGFPAWKKAGKRWWTIEDVKSRTTAKEKGFKPFHTIVGLDLVKDIVDHKEIGLIIDSRPKAKKYDKGHIPGALSIPASQFDKMNGLLPQDKHSLIVFYCGGYFCPLSHKSAYAAMNIGYSNVKVFAAGYPAWTAKYGKGTAGPAKAEAKETYKKMFKAGKEEGSLDFAAFEELVRTKADVLIVDVRDAKEFKAGTVPGAVNLPTEKLEKQLADWKPGKPVIFNLFHRGSLGRGLLHASGQEAGAERSLLHRRRDNL